MYGKYLIYRVFTNRYLYKLVGEESLSCLTSDGRDRVSVYLTDPFRSCPPLPSVPLPGTDILTV